MIKCTSTVVYSLQGKGTFPLIQIYHKWIHWRTVFSIWEMDFATCKHSSIQYWCPIL